MSEQTPAGIELMREFVPSSPFARKLGIEVVDLGSDWAHLRLPIDESLETGGGIVHGGALAALADTAATAACWTAAEITAVRGGATVSLTVNFTAAARGQSLAARAAVLRRGRSVCFAEVRVTDDDDELVAHVLVTYRFRAATPGA
jgi:uncharacterized protein (TIGR00369 family)